MTNPLVSVIVLSFNHEQYVHEAINSVRMQTYAPVEIIAVDDASADRSGEILEELSKKHSFTFIQNKKNLGNCKSFNLGLAQAKGHYVIDLAADDLLLEKRIARGVAAFENLPEEYGVNFCDVELIDETGNYIKTHYKRDNEGKLCEEVPEGWIFKHLVERYIISTPSMMIKKTVLDDLDGYDETLSYEDFDFWVRSSKKYKYTFTDEILVKKRVVKRSHSSAQKKVFNSQIASTRKVCERAFLLCENGEEYKALLKRIDYENKWAIATGNLKEVLKFARLRKKTKNQLR